MAWDGYSKLYVGDNPADTAIVAGMLRAAGIEVRLSNALLWGGRGELPVTPDTAPTAWVPDAALAAAQKLLDQRNTVDDEAPWCCEQCNTEGEAGFNSCWKCGAPRSV